MSAAAHQQDDEATGAERGEAKPPNACAPPQRTAAGAATGHLVTFSGTHPLVSRRAPYTHTRGTAALMRVTTS